MKSMWTVGCLNLSSTFSPEDSAVSLDTLVLWLWASTAPSKEPVRELCQEHQTQQPLKIREDSECLQQH